MPVRLRVGVNAKADGIGYPDKDTELDILRRYLPDAAVDLVYLDPPFNSNRDYSVIN